MNAREQTTISTESGPTLRKRRGAVKACLARHDLASGFQPIEGNRGECLERLILALRELGPVFVAFGRYLSSRYDRIPASDCLRLGLCPHGRRKPLDPMPALHKTFGDDIWFGFRQLQEVPESFDLPTRRYRNLLPEESLVTVELADPHFQVAWQTDHLLIDELKGPLEKIWPHFQLHFDSVSADFRRDIPGEADLEHRIVWLTRISQQGDQVDPSDLEIPSFEENWSTSGILTTTSRPGTPLRLVFQEPETGDAYDMGLDRKALARGICLAWLQRALVGSWFPVDPNPDNLVILSQDRFLFTGGLTASLARPIQSKLLAYLMSVVAGNPDDAFTFMIGMLEPGDPDKEETLKHRLRQVVPFRDGGWGGPGMGESLAEHLFVQWRVAGECGFLPTEQYRHFCRGLGGVAFLSMKLVPGRDILRDALYEYRMKSGLNELAGMVNLEHFTGQTETFFRMMSELPRRFETALKQKTQTVPAGKTETAKPKAAHPRSVILSLVLVLISLILLSRFFGDSPWQDWTEPSAAILFLLVGGLLLRFLIRS